MEVGGENGEMIEGERREVEQGRCEYGRVT